MNALLTQSNVMIHLDPRKDGVHVPPWLAKGPQLVLEVGLNMAVQIPDLDVGEQGISATLSFNRRPFPCFIPWPAVFALVGEGGRAMVWPTDIPPEVVASAAPAAARRQGPKAAPVPETKQQEPSEPAADGPRAVPVLRPLPGGKGSRSPSAPPQSNPRPPGARSHLRRVK